SIRRTGSGLPQEARRTTGSQQPPESSSLHLYLPPQPPRNVSPNDGGDFAVFVVVIPGFLPQRQPVGVNTAPVQRPDTCPPGSGQRVRSEELGAHHLVCDRHRPSQPDQVQQESVVSHSITGMETAGSADPLTGNQPWAIAAEVFHLVSGGFFPQSLIGDVGGAVDAVDLPRPKRHPSILSDIEHSFEPL